MTDKLVEIPASEWPKLREMYRREWPTNIIGCYTVDTFQRWLDQREKGISNLAIYSLNGDWQADGTYVGIHRYQLFANTLSASLDRLSRALSLFDWSHGYKVSTLCARFRPAVMPCMSGFNLDFDSLTSLYYLPKEQAVQLDLTCPPGIRLAPLSVENAETINDIWPNRHAGSLFFIKQIIELSPNVGAFDENGELVAWCLRLQAGPHGALQVKETHLRRGLGLLVCKALARKLGELGLDSCACVGPENVPSNRIFQNAGFRVIDQAYWIRNIPSVPVEWVD